MTMPFPPIDPSYSGASTPRNLAALRRTVWADGTITQDSVAAILTMHRQLDAPGAEWADFLIEAISVWLVDQQQPRGYVDAAQAQWLIGQMDAGGHRVEMIELELLVAILEKAICVPQPFKDYALRTVEQAVLAGFGPTRDGRPTVAGAISAGEARLLRRLVFAGASVGDARFEGDGPASVSRAEAEMLFRVKDATLRGENAAEWRDLFVQGVGNYLQGFGGFAAPDRGRKMELESFMDQPEPGVLGFMARMRQARPGHARVGPSDAQLDAEHIGGSWHLGRLVVHNDAERLGDDLTAAARDAARLTPPESAWLDAGIGADGQIDPLEQALREFLAKG